MASIMCARKLKKVHDFAKKSKVLMFVWSVNINIGAAIISHQSGRVETISLLQFRLPQLPNHLTSIGWASWAVVKKHGLCPIVALVLSHVNHYHCCSK